MKFPPTRLLLLSALFVGLWNAAYAADVVVQVGPNGSNNYSPQNITIRPGDVVVFSWVSGFHPTVSDSSPAAWAPFTPSSGSSNRIAGLAVGVYPYHCTVHAFQVGPGQPYIGMVGSITVAVPTATLDPRAAGLDLAVYPNPSRGQITVQLNQKVGADYKLRLSNIIGQEVRTVALKPELTTAGLPLDLSDLHAGMYFYSLLVDGKVVTTKRLVLQN